MKVVLDDGGCGLLVLFRLGQLVGVDDHFATFSEFVEVPHVSIRSPYFSPP